MWRSESRGSGREGYKKIKKGRRHPLAAPAPRGGGAAARREQRSVVPAGARPVERAPQDGLGSSRATIPPPPFKKLFFHLERLCVAMKTDFPRGPTLPLRGIGLEKPKWPESRDKKGPLNGGPEKRAEAGSPLRAPLNTLRTTAWERFGPAGAPGKPPKARSPTAPCGPQACLPSPAP